MTAVEQLTFASASVELTVLPAIGGRILGLRAFGQELLRRPTSLAELRRDPLFWGSYPLVPWCNRIPGGRLVFDGLTRRLPAEFDGHAIHGHGFAAAWHHLGDGRIEFEKPGDPTYPWPYRAWQRFEVEDEEVRLELGIENTGWTRMPAGLGIHPWWDATDGLEVRLPADRVYPSAAGVPLPGGPEAVAGPRNLRALVAPTWGLDEVWTNLSEHRIDLRWPRSGIKVAYEFSGACDHVVLAAVPCLSAVAIEPQTHVTDGHRRRETGEPGGITSLEPGELLNVSYRIRILPY